jgi:hypothetical protein
MDKLNLICGLIAGLFALSFSQVTQTPGTWKNLTPAGMDVSQVTGIMSVAADPVRKNEVYFFGSSGIGVYKSTNYGDSWTKINSGINGDKLQTGAPWYYAVDPNPNRDPLAPLTIYLEQGYGAGGVWKSTDGGVNWKNVWENNIYGADGVTNIFADVGSDCAAFHIVSPSNPNHLILSLHSYWGSSGNNGVYETTDGGGKWIVHNSTTFNFQPHSDCLFPIDENIWCVSHGSEVFRTTNAGVSWSKAAGTVGGSGGRSWVNLAQCSYVGIGGLYKSVNKGATWTTLRNNWTGWIATTPTRIYIASSNEWSAQYFSAPLNNDAQWTQLPAASAKAGYYAITTFDGAHYMVIAANETGGVWRYVEPAVSSASMIPSRTAPVQSIKIQKTALMPMTRGGMVQSLMVSSGRNVYDVKGREAKKYW